MDERILGQEPAERAELLAGGKFPVDEKPGGFRKCRVGCQVLDVVTAIPEDSLFPVDESDLALRAARIGVAVVERH